MKKKKKTPKETERKRKTYRKKIQNRKAKYMPCTYTPEKANKYKRIKGTGPYKCGAFEINMPVDIFGHKFVVVSMREFVYNIISAQFNWARCDSLTPSYLFLLFFYYVYFVLYICNIWLCGRCRYGIAGMCHCTCHGYGSGHFKRYTCGCAAAEDEEDTGQNQTTIIIHRHNRLWEK